MQEQILEEVLLCGTWRLSLCHVT